MLRMRAWRADSAAQHAHADDRPGSRATCSSVQCDRLRVGAGPGTIAEALISGLPILLNGNVPCQEEGNIPFVVDNGAGAFERDPSRIADIIADWFSERGAQKRAAMAAAAKALGRPDALFKIVRDLADLALQGKTSAVHLPQPTFAAAATV